MTYVHGRVSRTKEDFCPLMHQCPAI